MGLAGKRSERFYCEPGHRDFLELVGGPFVISKNRIDVMRNRWNRGGREAVEANYREPGRRSWAWWHFSVPLRDRKLALGLYATEAEALIGLGYTTKAERELIADLGTIAKQILTDPAPTETEIRAARRAERRLPTFPHKSRALKAR